MTNKFFAAVALSIAVGIVCIFGVGVHSLLKRPAFHAGMPPEPTDSGAPVTPPPAASQPEPQTMIAKQCSLAVDQSTFEVQALRSEMMVLATSCREAKRYNAFIRRFKAGLQANERAMSAYYQARGGQVAHDRFVTDLANAMSEHAIGQGASFCANEGALFTEAMAVSPTGLPQFAADRALIPEGLTTCTTETVPTQPRKRHRT
jgi:hypothetical protein